MRAVRRHFSESDETQQGHMKNGERGAKHIIGGGRLAFSLVIDGTNVAKEEEVSEKYWEIIGEGYPNHTDNDLTLVSEVKISVMSCQRVQIGTC